MVTTKRRHKAVLVHTGTYFKRYIDSIQVMFVLNVTGRGYFSCEFGDYSSIKLLCVWGGEEQMKVQPCPTMGH